MTKEQIINDETLFQRACEKFVERNVIYCVSSLMYDIGQNLEASAKIFGFDYDEAIGWFQRDDWEEPVVWFIRKDATKDELEEIAGDNWLSILDSLKVPDDVDELEDWFEGEPVALDSLREEVIASIPDFEEVGRNCNLEPIINEVYEHWLVENHFWNKLEACGEVVFEFAGLQVWGRQTTGQSVSIDGVIRRMVRELPEDHWIFRDEK